MGSGRRSPIGVPAGYSRLINSRRYRLMRTNRSASDLPTVERDLRENRNYDIPLVNVAPFD